MTIKRAATSLIRMFDPRDYRQVCNPFAIIGYLKRQGSFDQDI